MSKRSQQRAQERSATRLGVVQALYQMEAGETPLDKVIEEFQMHRFGIDVDGIELPLGDEALFEGIMRGVIEFQVEIDRGIDGVLKEGWRLDRLDSTLRAILRAGAYELLHRKDIPPKVSISEYVHIAEGFFGKDEVGFVNGALDRLGQAHRAAELSN